MYRFSYAEVLEETPQTARERERQALEYAIELLKTAEAHGQNSREAIDAIYITRKIWAFFIEDLAKPENDLPDQLRADLISIGIWIMREADDIRTGKSSNFKGLIEVSEMIAGGLR